MPIFAQREVIRETLWGFTRHGAMFLFSFLFKYDTFSTTSLVSTILDSVVSSHLYC